MKKRLFASFAITALVAASLVGATSAAQGASRTVTVWQPQSGGTLAAWQAAMARIEKANPGLTIKSVGSVDMAKSLAAINSGTGPDISLSNGAGNLGWFCGSGAWQSLNKVIASAKGLKLATTFTPPAINYSTSGSKRCALPASGGTEVTTFYYNKTLLAKAGFNNPPKTTTDLLNYSKKLTTFNSDGSIKTAGFIPWAGYASNDMDAMWLGWMFGATWFDASGQPTFASDTKWARAFTWQKNFIAQVYGGGDYKKGAAAVTKFAASAGDFWGGDNDFVKGRVAMMTSMDWMSQMFCDLDWVLNPCNKPVVNFGIAPLPMDDRQVSRYGSSPVGGALMGISKGSKNFADAWLVMKSLATDSQLGIELSNLSGSIPTLVGLQNSSKITFPAFYDNVYDITKNKNSGWHALRNTGAHREETEMNNFMAAWQAGQVSNLKDGLSGVVKTVNDILANNYSAGSQG